MCKWCVSVSVPVCSCICVYMHMCAHKSLYACVMYACAPVCVCLCCVCVCSCPRTKLGSRDAQRPGAQGGEAQAGRPPVMKRVVTTMTVMVVE